MVKDWAEWVCEIDPSIMCGHNVAGYDLPYINFCHNKYSDDPIILGRCDKPIKFSNYESKFRVDGSRDLHYHKAQIYGREIVDTMFLAYKYDLNRKYESYGLKKIIAQEGLEKPGRTFYDASKIRENYLIPEELEKIKVYAEEDGDDALALYDLMCPPFFYMTQMIPKPYQLIIESATGSQLNSMMVRSYLQDKHSIPQPSEAVEFEGAISFGEPGIYANAVSYDIASLYPSVMLQHNIHCPIKDPKQHMSQLLDVMRTERLKNKKLGKETGDSFYKHLDTSYKVLINSLYGFMGASGLNYNYPEGAALVTRIGRETLIFSMDWAKSKGYTVPKGDTDSITLWNAGEPFSPELKTSLLLEINSQLPEHIKFELDDCYDSLLVFKAKNYAYRIGDKITIKGSAVKSSTKSQVLKEFINNGLTMLLYGKGAPEVAALYEAQIHDIMNVKTQDDIKKYASRKTLSSTMQESERANETKVIAALEGSNYREGDRFYTYYKSDDSISLVENFDGDYNKPRLLKNLYTTAEIFTTVLPEELFKNYSLKKNFKLLDNQDQSRVG
jgi:DNA polymerase elongation subunit (family B)